MIDGPNLYAYCGNNPVNWVDVWGLYKNNPQQVGWIKWWLNESVVPGPYGQPTSEWKSGSPTGWGNPMKYTEQEGGVWMWAERGVMIVSIVAISVAAGAMIYEAGAGIRIEFHLPHSRGPHNYPHLQGIRGPGWGKTVWRIP